MCCMLLTVLKADTQMRLTTSFSEESVRLKCAALASAWHVGEVQRHDGVWCSMFTRVAHDKWSKEHDGTQKWFQSVSLGCGERDIQLPSSLCDDAEVERVGEIVAAATPSEQRAGRVHQSGHRRRAPSGSTSTNKVDTSTVCCRSVGVVLRQSWLEAHS